MKKTNLSRALITIVILLFSFNSHSQEKLKSIQGIITHFEAPIVNVNIVVEGTSKGTKTDAKGYYSLKANVGDVIKFSHVAYKNVSIIVEDVTSTINLQLTENTNSLDAAVITTRKKVNTISEIEKKMNVELQTPFGIINPKKSGFSINYISGDKINFGGTIVDALAGKFAGISQTGVYPNSVLTIRGRPVTYIVDGFIKDADAVPVGLIEDIYILKVKATVIIRTKNNIQIAKEKQNELVEKNKNQNFYSNDAVALDNPLENNTRITKTITGKVTDENYGLSNVNIKIKNTSRGTKSDIKGEYSIEANEGDILQFSHVSYKTVSIVVEDITSTLNINMIDDTNELDEVVITTKSANGEVIVRKKKADEAFQSSRGNFNPKTAGYAVGFVDGNEISNTYLSLKEALVGKISGYTLKNEKAYLRGGNSSVLQDYPVAWEIDGVFYNPEDEPAGLDLSQIESVHALKSLAATNKYGTLGAGGVIVITTKFGNINAKNTATAINAEKYKNKNYYYDDAISYNGNTTNELSNNLKNLESNSKAISYYNSIPKDKLDFDKLITISKTFLNYYNDKLTSKNILMTTASLHNNNPEIQKAVAFHLQKFGFKNEAVKVYENIIRLRPTYAQSFRDLANAYKENNQFKQSWRLYMSYLMKGHSLDDEGIGNIIYNEMEYLFFNRGNQTKIRHKFIPKNETLEDFRNDVRIVFEWHTSEAEFDLEFVSPDMRAYVYQHTLEANQELITLEKETGFSSKEFIIDDVGNGEWLVNLTYLGNKKNVPTYLKMTVYTHWGKPKQKEEIQVFRLDQKHQKFQLKKINKSTLLVSN